MLRINHSSCLGKKRFNKKEKTTYFHVAASDNLIKYIITSYQNMRCQMKSAKPKTIPEALTNFNSYPDSAQVRLPVVKALFGVSSATVWRMVKAKTLATRKLTPRTTTFNVGELRQALA